jgi:hypothetical protein
LRISDDDHQGAVLQFAIFFGIQQSTGQPVNAHLGGQENGTILDVGGMCTVGWWHGIVGSTSC